MATSRIEDTTGRRDRAGSEATYLCAIIRPIDACGASSTPLTKRCILSGFTPFRWPSTGSGSMDSFFWTFVTTSLTRLSTAESHLEQRPRDSPCGI